MFHLCKNQVVALFTSKMFEKQLWKNDILVKMQVNDHWSKWEMLRVIAVGT